MSYHVCKRSEAKKTVPHVTLKSGQASFPELGKISIKMFDIKFYPAKEGELIPLSEEKMFTFDVARQEVDPKSKDLLIFAYAKYEGEP